uniref:SWIM-type domain-containing protein n=1 Tax=Lactuca sativa TaxID=4236 RepID=A0A9R1WJ85_LACSA|nr:hypothetical protein LSAT_V11C100007810 [Lactuca sativa]
MGFYHQGQEVSKWRGNCATNIQLKIDEFGKDMSLWTVVPSGGDVFETWYCYNRYMFDLATHTCTCNLWKLFGIPCVHSQATINYIHKDSIQFLSSWFHKDKYVATYMQNIQPIGGSNCGQGLIRRMHGRPKIKRVKHASESQDVKYPSQRLKVPRTIRCGKCQQLGHNKISCTNDKVPKPLSQKGILEDLGKMGEANRSLTNSLQLGLLYQEGMVLLLFWNLVIKMVLLQFLNLVIKMVKTPNGKQRMIQENEDVSLTCDEAFDDLFTHTPNGKQHMSQEKDDVQEQENGNEVKVNERLTLKELLQSGYTHADALVALKEVYGEVQEIDVDERDVQEREIKERQVGEREIEERKVEEREVKEGEAEEGEVE